MILFSWKTRIKGNVNLVTKQRNRMEKQEEAKRVITANYS